MESGKVKSEITVIFAVFLFTFTIRPIFVKSSLFIIKKPEDQCYTDTSGIQTFIK
jgi:capsule polysaccharide export protein KpsE/RkpR